MAVKESKRTKVLNEIKGLQAKRRKQFLKCGAVLVGVFAVVGLTTFVKAVGLVPDNSIMIGAVSMFAAIGLAIIGGMASIEATKCTNTINGLAAKYSIRKEEYAPRRKK